MERRYVRAQKPKKAKSPKKKQQGINLKTEFEAFAAKRPVNVPGAQVRAQKAYERIVHLFTDEERTQLSIAWNHATGTGLNEGRGEFDSVCKKIRERLFPKKA